MTVSIFNWMSLDRRWRDRRKCIKWSDYNSTFYIHMGLHSFNVNGDFTSSVELGYLDSSLKSKDKQFYPVTGWILSWYNNKYFRIAFKPHFVWYNGITFHLLKRHLINTIDQTQTLITFWSLFIVDRTRRDRNVLDSVCTVSDWVK